MNLDMKMSQIHACTSFHMFKAENSCPKCPLYASPNPKFMRDANAKFEEFKYIEGFNAK
jgi:hypothetical protein